MVCTHKQVLKTAVAASNGVRNTLNSSDAKTHPWPFYGQFTVSGDPRRVRFVIVALQRIALCFFYNDNTNSDINTTQVILIINIIKKKISSINMLILLSILLLILSADELLRDVTDDNTSMMTSDIQDTALT